MCLTLAQGVDLAFGVDGAPSVAVCRDDGLGLNAAFDDSRLRVLHLEQDMMVDRLFLL